MTLNSFIKHLFNGLCTSKYLDYRLSKQSIRIRIYYVIMISTLHSPIQCRQNRDSAIFQCGRCTFSAIQHNYFTRRSTDVQKYTYRKSGQTNVQNLHSGQFLSGVKKIRKTKCTLYKFRSPTSRFSIQIKKVPTLIRLKFGIHEINRRITIWICDRNCGSVIFQYGHHTLSTSNVIILPEGVMFKWSI